MQYTIIATWVASLDGIFSVSSFIYRYGAGCTLPVKSTDKRELLIRKELL